MYMLLLIRSINRSTPPIIRYYLESDENVVYSV